MCTILLDILCKNDTMVLVRTLIDHPSLGVKLVVRGASSREVSWVTEGNYDDIAEVAGPGALVILTHHSMPSAGWLHAVAELSRFRVSALGFRVASPDLAVPQELTQAATTYQLPLLSVPPTSPQALLARSIVDLGRSDDLREAREALFTQRKLLDLAHEGSGPTGIVSAVASLTGRDTAIVSARGDIIAATGGYSRGHRDEHHEMQRLEVGSGRQLVVEGGALGPEGVAAFTSAAIVLSIEDRTHSHNTVLERERWGRVTKTIVTGAGDAQSLCTLLDPEQRVPSDVHVIVVQGRAESIAAWRSEPRTGEHRFVTRYPIEEHTNTEIVPGIALAWQVISPRKLEAALSDIARADLDALVGARTSVRDAALSRRSAESLLPRLSATEQLYGNRARPRVLRADQTSLLLTELTSIRGGGALSRSILAGLHAATDGPELLETLESFLRHHGQRGPAAASLGIHRNTLRGRLTRIEALLERSLDSPDDRAELWVALRLNPATAP